MTPPEALHPSRAAVLAAVIHLADAGELVTYARIAEATGIESHTVIHHHLQRLRDDGLVTWQPGLRATLRPTVTVRRVGPIARRLRLLRRRSA